MAAMSSFDSEKCCHLVCAHAACAGMQRRPSVSDLQYIHVCSHWIHSDTNAAIASLCNFGYNYYYYHYYYYYYYYYYHYYYYYYYYYYYIVIILLIDADVNVAVGRSDVCICGSDESVQLQSAVTEYHGSVLPGWSSDSTRFSHQRRWTS